MKLSIRKNQKGATVIEYALIAALISISAIVAMGAIGGGVKDKLEEVESALGAPATASVTANPNAPSV